MPPDWLFLTILAEVVENQLFFIDSALQRRFGKTPFHTANDDFHTAIAEFHTANADFHTANGDLHTADGDLISARGEFHTADGVCRYAGGDFPSANADFCNATGVRRYASRDFLPANGNFHAAIAVGRHAVSQSKRRPDAASTGRLEARLHIFRHVLRQGLISGNCRKARPVPVCQSAGLRESPPTHQRRCNHFPADEPAAGSGVSGLMISSSKSGLAASRSSTGYFSPP